MKKTFSALLLAGMLPLTVADTLAYQTGTINFTGNVAEGTCTVKDLNKTIDLRSTSVEMANNAAHNVMIFFEHSGNYFNITGCPTSITKANIRFDYVSESNPQYLKLTSGSVPGLALMLSSGGDVTKPGHIKTYQVRDGKASGNLQVLVYRNVNDPDIGAPAQTVTEGTFGAVANLTMSFE